SLDPSFLLHLRRFPYFCPLEHYAIGQSPYSEYLQSPLASAFSINPYTCSGNPLSIQVLVQTFGSCHRETMMKLASSLLCSYMFLCEKAAFLKAIPSILNCNL
ncbi:hypothetical protein HMI54_013680, partial [Coelomomyces lativittatus]